MESVCSTSSSSVVLATASGARRHKGRSDHPRSRSEAEGAAVQAVVGEGLLRQMDDQHFVASFQVVFKYWTQEYSEGESSYMWMLNRLRIPLDNVNLHTINAARQAAMSGLYHMYKVGSEKGIVNNTTETGVELTRMYVWVKQMIYWTSNALACMEMSRLTSHLENIVPSFEFAMGKPSVLVPDGQEMTDFHKVLIFMLQECKRENLRKMGPDMYAQIQTESGHLTHAWRRLCSIRRFVYERVDKETRFEQWYILSKNANMVTRLAQWLEEGQEQELETLVPNRYYISFLNGVYDVKRDRFMPYGDPRLTHEVVSCRYIEKRMDENLFSNQLMTKPALIPTPVFEGILVDQGLSRMVIVWILVMVGRMLYDLNDRDSWQKILFIQGKAGTGKSTIANLVRSIYEPGNVGILNSNCEAQWALSGIYDKFLWICMEVKRNFRLDTASLQSIVTGEATVINKKYSDPFTQDWTVPGMMMGNEIPMSWVDVQGALVRRIVLVRFERKPPKINPRLMQEIRDELPFLIVKMNRLYIAAVNKYGNKDLSDRDVLPAYFTETQERFQKQSQPLRALLTSDGDFKLEPHRYMLLDEIKEAFNMFCRLNNITQQQFDEDNFNYVFEDLKLRMENVVDGIEYNERLMYGTFVFGIGLKEGGGDNKAAYEKYRRAHPIQAKSQGEDGDGSGGATESEGEHEAEGLRREDDSDTEEDVGGREHGHDIVEDDDDSGEADEHWQDRGRERHGRHRGTRRATMDEEQEGDADEHEESRGVRYKTRHQTRVRTEAGAQKRRRTAAHRSETTVGKPKTQVSTTARVRQEASHAPRALTAQQLQNVGSEL